MLSDVFQNRVRRGGVGVKFMSWFNTLKSTRIISTPVGSGEKEWGLPLIRTTHNDYYGFTKDSIGDRISVNGKFPES